MVTATRVPTPLSHVLSDTTVLRQDDLQRYGPASVAEVLQRVGGLQMSNNGGPASTTSLFLRGAESRHVAVLIDGVRVDTQSGAGGATWEALPLSQVERIEIVRGPASAVYGSDAIAGVVQIFTLKGQPGAPRLSVGGGFGTQRTRDGEASVRGAADGIDYAAALGGRRSAGFNAITDPANPSHVPDRDGEREQHASARVGLTLSPTQRVEVSGLASRNRAQYDGGNPDDVAWHGVDTAQFRWESTWRPGWKSQFALGQSGDHYRTDPSPYSTDTQVRNLSWVNDYTTGAHRWNLTFERRIDHLDNPNLDGFSQAVDAGRHQNSVAGGYGWRAESGLAWQINLRHDEDSEFGGQTTGSLGAAWPLSSNWKLHATGGTGFRAPTLYQRYSEYGNAALEPERSRNLELGAAYTSGVDSFRATLFRNRLSHLIDFDPALGRQGVCASAFGCYVNVGQQATLQGLSLRAGTEWLGVQWAANVDLLRARNDDTGKDLARRARRTANLSAEAPWGDWRLGADWRLASARYDRADNVNRLGGYGVLGVHAQREIVRDWTLLLRGDNVTDKNYEVAKGYATAPASAYVGVRWSPR